MEKTNEENIDNSPQKKNNLKIIIPENSNEDIEPSKNGLNLSQNTDSNSPLIHTDKKEEITNILLNKDDDNIVKDEELFKITPHFLNDNKVTSESLKEELALKRPFVQNNDNKKVINTPLTSDNKRFYKNKFNFDFEAKENGVIVPKEKIKKEGNKGKKTNIFRAGNKNINYNKNKFLNTTKQNYSKNMIYSKKDRQNFKINHSPLSSSLISLNNNINQQSPIKPLKNKGGSKYDNNIRKCSIIDNEKKLFQPRPNSVKNNSSQEKRNKQNNLTHDLNKDKKLDIKNNDKKNIQKKKYANSVNKNIILPKLLDNKKINIKNQLQTEFTNLFKILPNDFEEDPEIKNKLGFILQKIYGIREYIHKNSQCSTCETNKNL